MAPNPRGDQHAWFRSRLDAQALGLLDKAEERQFLEHASQCESCGAAMKAYSESAARLAREGHIPAGLLARWDRARRRLRGVARAMVREHLATCAECRADLEAIGFKPELEVLSDEDIEELVPAAPGPSVRPPRRARRQWGPWLLGGMVGAGLATAASVVVVLTLRPPVPSESAHRSEGAPTMASPAPAIADYRLESIPGLVSLRGATRESGKAVAFITIDPGARYVVLGLPDLFLPDSTTLELNIVGADQAEIVKARYRYGDLFPRRQLLFGRRDEALRTGDYRLKLAAPFASSTEVAELRFRLVTRATP